MRNLILIFFIVSSNFGFSQTIYPPNYSFEDDTNAVDFSPWNLVGDVSYGTSIGLYKAPHGKFFIGMHSVRKSNEIINSEVHNTFKINSRPKYLEFYTFYSTSDYRDKFKTKLKMFKSGHNNSQISICTLDSLMDTATINSEYRPGWFHVKIPLEKYYLNELIPDSCYLEINAGMFFNVGVNNGHSLFVDKITLEGTAFVSVPSIDLVSDNIVIYPNPSSKLVKIDFKGEKSMQSIEVIDALGRLVIQQQANSNQIEVDVSCLMAGNYILKIKDENGLVFTKKLAVE